MPTTSRHVVPTIVALAGWLCVAASTCAAPAARPNVLFVLCDDLRPDALGCYGSAHVRTPHLDALAADGV